MNIEALSERLTALKESNIQVQKLVERLAAIDFQPGSIPLDDSDEGIVSELVAEILLVFKEQEDDLEFLKEEVIDLNPGRAEIEFAREKENLEIETQKAIEDLKTQIGTFRRAQLIAKRRLEAAQREERIILTKSFLEYEQTSLNAQSAISELNPKKESQKSVFLSKEEKEINASSDVTAALRRTHEMMSNELSRSQFAHETLQESTMALTQLAEKYSSLDTLLLTSKNLLGTLLKSQKSDTWYLETAFYVLLLTICWLVYRRLLHGPIFWLFLYPLKMFFKGLNGVLTKMGLNWF
ncbi:putative sec20 domain-containing protein [Golovinomyces cichoracearum]|uniref:Putative sec20 domain-containing protein n=1 Tax=Golovinomyces cichoracearum TaxID=62708 RepID=A0A420IX85_9PEZI|nr:putative sec20 domain-containing protein [Golovinomyces cichoracearum]